MSEKLLTPLDVMPPELRRWLESVMTKYQHLDLSPSTASSTSLGKQYEVFRNLWEGLRWESSLSDLQQREQYMTQLRTTKPATVTQRLNELRANYAKTFRERKQTLQQKKKDWELNKQQLRNNLRAQKRTLQQKQQQLTWTSEQWLEQQLRSYDSEWTRAEQRIARSKQTLTQLRQQHAQHRADLPNLVTTWKAGATARETHYRQQLNDWYAKNPALENDALSLIALTTRKQQTTERQQRLTERRSNLHWRRRQRNNAEQRLNAEWGHASKLPDFSQPLSNEQRMAWLRNSRPLKDTLRELRQLTVLCATLKAKLLNGGFLSADEYPEIDAAWADWENRP